MQSQIYVEGKSRKRKGSPNPPDQPLKIIKLMATRMAYLPMEIYAEIFLVTLDVETIKEVYLTSKPVKKK